METPRWSVRRQLLEPARFWIRFVPRFWPGPRELWTDAAAGRLGEPAPEGRLPTLPEGRELELGDRLYLPPVQTAAAAWRDGVAARFAEAGTPVLVQLLPGQPRPALEPSVRIHFLHDPLPALARTGGSRASGVIPEVPGAAVLWPLLGGLTEDPRLWRHACGAMADAGVKVVQPQALDLPPGQRRRLAQRCPERLFHAVFHRPPPPELEFDGIAQGFGLEPFLPRPAAGSGGREESNRRLSGLLGRAGEMWLRLGRAAPRGDELFRAGRWIESTSHDVAALAREGNLALVPQIEGAARRVLEEWAEAERSAFVEELEESYRRAAGAPQEDPSES